MNRLLTSTAVALILGLTPALAQQEPIDDATQNPPAASQPDQGAQPLPSDEGESAAPAAPESDAMPQAAAPETQPAEPATPPSQSSEAPESIAPAAPKTVEAGQFLSKQGSDDWLASNLIGQTVYNSQDEMIGEINDLLTDNGGKINAVLVGFGGFLGMGEKDVALRFEDLRFSRDENNNIKVIANVSEETLAAAPDFETLSEQSTEVGAKSDREDMGDQKGASDTY